MKKLLFTAPILISILLQASIPAHSNPLPTPPSLADINKDVGTLTPQGVQQVAKNITVRISSENNGGSGVLIAQKDNSYLVLTNAHVVRRSTQLEIQAPDGQKYRATPMDGGFSAKYDLALLKFTSKTKYALAKLTDVAGSPIEPTRTIYSAGFPFDSKDIRITQGQVSQLTDIPFDDGTQIGYTIDKGKKGIRQGMSGGAIFDSQGNFLGINTIGVAPILPDYTYNDGSKPIAKLKDLYARANWGIPVYNFLTNVKADILYGYDNLPKVEHQVTPTGFMAKLNDKLETRKKTVRIENSNGSGSGVIVASEGDTYYVLTAKHVIQDQEDNTHRKFTDGKIITYDQDLHPVTSTIVAEGVDLAVVKFTSSNKYSVATLGEHSTRDEDLVFVGGFPNRGDIKSPLWQWQLNPGFIFSKEKGKLRVQDNLSFSEGYDLIYSSISYAGMSGGPVFDTKGNVIGIHGKAESTGRGGKTAPLLGQSLGISIQTFIELAKTKNLEITPNLSKLLKIDSNRPSNLSPDERKNVITTMENISQPQKQERDDGRRWLAYGNQLYRTRQYNKSVAAFDKAIAKNQILSGNYGKALSLGAAKKFDLAATAIDLAIAAVPTNKEERANYYYFWKKQSSILRDLSKYPAALRSIEEAIAIKPNDLILGYVKSTLLYDNGQYQASINAVNNLIRTNNKKEEWFFYAIRGLSESKLGNKPGATEDLDRVVKLYPSAASYTFRGNTKSNLGDKREALADFDFAIAIDPNQDNPYALRGIIKSELGDKIGALADYNRVIAIDSNQANNYTFRGIIKSELGDNKGAITDFDRAIAIDPNDDLNYSIRAGIKSNSGDPKGAIADFDRAIKINPNKASNYALRGDSKSDLGDYRGAIDDCTKAIKIDGKNNTAYVFRAIAKSKLGDKKGAIEDCTQAIENNPKSSTNYETYKIRGKNKFELGDKQGAVLDLNRAIELNPKYTLAYGLRGDIKLGLGDKQGAIADYTQAIKLDPKFAGAYRMRGFVKSDLGNKREAILDYDKAIELNPKDADAYILRGVTKFELGDNISAIANTKSAMVINPNSASAYANLGAFKIINGKEREALPDLERAIKLDPKMSYAYAGQGIVRETLGDKQGAISDYKQALKLNSQILTEWKKQAESVGKYNATSYQKYQQMIQKLEAGSKL
jgi:tetratricopeptide (TPR) repeat protein/S1-C subfamily serine protease